MFFENFSIEKILSLKCFAARWNKLKHCKFLFKSLPEEVSQLEQKDYSTVVAQSLNRSDFAFNEQLLKAWTDLKPSTPDVNLTFCYGQVKIQDKYFVITDLIEDNVKSETVN
jgi:hypothetical protein